MAGWHHWLDGHGFGWTLGDGDGQGGLACGDSWGRTESDTTERLTWTEGAVSESCTQGRSCIRFWRNKSKHNWLSRSQLECKFSCHRERCSASLLQEECQSKWQQEIKPQLIKCPSWPSANIKWRRETGDNGTPLHVLWEWTLVAVHRRHCLHRPEQKN